eukprot:4739886-Alexandrium_andersonii.AAC.1
MPASGVSGRRGCLSTSRAVVAPTARPRPPCQGAASNPGPGGSSGVPAAGPSMLWVRSRSPDQRPNGC